MLGRIRQWSIEKERKLRVSFGDHIPEDQMRRARWHFMVMDHACLRLWWHNFFKLDDGVYRANQPSPERLEYYRDIGVKTILNLRGPSGYSHYIFEKTACVALGLKLVDHRLYASRLPQRNEILGLEKLFRSIERPFVMHCKSGADRAGLAAALYQIMILNLPVEVAQKQLSVKYLHVKRSKKGVLDHLLEVYRRFNQVTPTPFRDWVENHYDPQAITDSFAAETGIKADDPK